MPASADVPWSDVLDNLESAVSQAVSDAADRARQLQEAAQANQSSPKPAVWETRLGQLRERFEVLPARATAANGKVADVETALVQAEEALQRWMREAERAREKLATWVGRAVG